MMLDVTDIDDFMVLANSLYGILQAQSNINFLMIVLQASMWIDYKIKSDKKSYSYHYKYQRKPKI